MPSAINSDILRDIAQRAYFYFDVDLVDGSDVYRVAGDGTDDLDSLIFLMETRLSRVKLDIGLNTSNLQPVTLAQVQELRADYISFYGDVSKPSLEEPSGVATEARI